MVCDHSLNFLHTHPLLNTSNLVAPIPFHSEPRFKGHQLLWPFFRTGAPGLLEDSEAINHFPFLVNPFSYPLLLCLYLALSPSLSLQAGLSLRHVNADIPPCLICPAFSLHLFSSFSLAPRTPTEPQYSLFLFGFLFLFCLPLQS